ncbi:MAG: hypothetical protein IPL78_01470 [Chloroflexi bacterium]|nr:hypothetical protein [Chloroflexota bacterium]
MRRLLILTTFTLFFLVACQQQGVFRPEIPTPTISNDTILGEPILVSFSQLAENLERYQNTLIRVSGVYTPLGTPTCFPERGPLTRWTLVSDNKQMKVLRFEHVVLPLAWEGLNMTVDGVWRKYEGPLGCGKNAAAGVTWYLDAVRIIEPNPMPDFLLNNQPTPSSDNGTEIPPNVTPFPDEPPPLGTPSDTGYPPEQPEGAITATLTPTLFATPTPTPSRPVGITPSPQGTPSSTPTPTATPTASPTAGTGTPEGTPTETPGPGTPSSTPPGTPSPEPTGDDYPPSASSTPYP